MSDRRGGPGPDQAPGGGGLATEVKSVKGGAGTVHGWLTEPCGRAAWSIARTIGPATEAPSDCWVWYGTTTWDRDLGVVGRGEADHPVVGEPLAGPSGPSRS